MKQIINYSLKIVFKRYSIYIIMMAGILSQIFISFSNKYFMSSIENSEFYNWIFFIPIYITTSMILILSAFTIFKLSKRSSEELFTRSLPIKRSKVFLSRYLSLIIIIIIIAFAWFIISYLTSFIDKDSQEDMFKYAGGISIGIIIISVFILSGILLIGSILRGKVFIAFTATLASFFPFFTVVNQTVYKETYSPQYKFYSLNKDLSLDDIYYVDNSKTSQVVRTNWNKYNPRAYEYLQKIDIYNHFSNLVSLFNIKSNSWYSEEKAKINSPYKIIINGISYNLLIDQSLIFHLANDEQKRFDHLIKDESILNALELKKAEISKLSIEKQIYFIKELIARATRGISSDEKVKEAFEETNKISLQVEKIYFVKGLSLPVIQYREFLLKHNFPLSDKSSNDLVTYSSSVNSYIRLSSEGTIPVFKEHDEVNYLYLILAFILISIVFTTISGILYVKEKRKY